MMAQQKNEDDNRTKNLEDRKWNHVKDQAHEDPDKTKRIEEQKKKQNEGS